MNSDNFSDFIEQPSHLYQIPYEELKSLVLQYPYCQNLRYLLLKKSKMENHRDYDKNLHMAATFSPDRAFLFQQIQKTAMTREAQEAYELAEDFLELKDLREVQKKFSEIQVQEPEEETVRTDAISIDPGPSVPDADVPTPAFSLPEEEPSAPADAEDEMGHSPEPESYTDLFPLLIEDIVLDMAPAIDIAHETNLHAFVLNPVEAEPSTDSSMLEDGIAESRGPEPVTFNLEAALLLDAAALISTIENLSFEEVLPKKETLKVKAFELDSSLIFDAVALLSAMDDLSFEETIPEVKTPKVKVSSIPLEIISEKSEPRKPTPKTSFSSWLRQFQSPQVSVQLNQIMEVEKPKKKKRKNKENNEAKALAVKSVQDHGLASETLADLLAKQGHYTKSYEMYMRLKSIHPERSEYFNEKLKEIKPKLR